MWIVGGLLAYLIVGVPFWVAVLIGAIVTPTDPVVASSIVAGGVAERNLPARLRHAISSESGFNDGLALPFVVLPVLVLTEPPGEVLGHWLTHTVLLEIVGGAALASLMGYLAGKTLRWAERKETMERTSLLTISLALSLTVLGVTELLHLNGVLAAFVAGGDLSLLRPAHLRAVGYGAAVAGVVGVGLEGTAPGRGGTRAQAAAHGAGPEAAARTASRTSEGRALPRMVRSYRGRGTLLRGLLLEGDGHQGSMGGR
jgi:Sodium/hydrogen exchanger family